MTLVCHIWITYKFCRILKFFWMKLKINIYVINGSKNKLINLSWKKKISINKFYYTNFLVFFELNYTVNTNSNVFTNIINTLYFIFFKNYKIGININLKYFYGSIRSNYKTKSSIYHIYQLIVNYWTSFVY